MDIAIKCEKRDLFGKNASRRLRREGKLPGIFYGTDTETVPLTLDKQDVIDILRSESGANTIFKVTFGSETREVMLKMTQIDSVSDKLLHADLIQVARDKEIKVSVPFSLVGDAVGVKTEGGFIDFVTREVEVECLPRHIPDNIKVDISELHMNQGLKIEEIPPPEGVRFLIDPTSIIVLVSAPTKEEEVEVEEIEEEAVEGEEVESAESEKQEEDREDKKE